MLLFSCAFVGCGERERRSEEEIARDHIVFYSGIEVPTNSKMVYRYFREGFRELEEYTVFQFESEPTDWLNKTSFSRGPNEQLERFFPPLYTLEEISQDYLPNFEEEYFGFMTDDYNYFIYVPQRLLLIVYVYIS